MSRVGGAFRAERSLTEWSPPGLSAGDYRTITVWETHSALIYPEIRPGQNAGDWSDLLGCHTD